MAKPLAERLVLGAWPYGRVTLKYPSTVTDFSRLLSYRAWVGGWCFRSLIHSCLDLAPDPEPAVHYDNSQSYHGPNLLPSFTNMHNVAEFATFKLISVLFIFFVSMNGAITAMGEAHNVTVVDTDPTITVRKNSLISSYIVILKLHLLVRRPRYRRRGNMQNRC